MYMTVWETEIATFLKELEQAQDEAMETLRRKQALLASSDTAGLKAIAPEERRVAERLGTCLKKRGELLKIAASEGLNADSIERLVEHFPKNSAVRQQVRRSIRRTRLIQYQSLTNWILTQRSILHLNQLIELIAFKGGSAPTYNRDKKRDTGNGGGNLVDRVA
ncbi:MAG TPA: hypothetical protein DEB39_01135 [Planctomycetaceae bacterium]|nr:hypothetical protein [Planctomycetaceae bacterium]